MSNLTGSFSKAEWKSAWAEDPVSVKVSGCSLTHSLTHSLDCTDSKGPSHRSPVPMLYILIPHVVNLTRPSLVWKCKRRKPFANYSVEMLYTERLHLLRLMWAITCIFYWPSFDFPVMKCCADVAFLVLGSWNYSQGTPECQWEIVLVNPNPSDLFTGNLPEFSKSYTVQYLIGTFFVLKQNLDIKPHVKK